MDKFPKFIIETNDELGDCLILSKCTYHKDLVTDPTKVKGGGWFSYDDGTFTFYGKSADYGEASLEDIKHCVENQITTFDNNYLIFKEKSSIAGLNKETFVEVTKIIFDARTDGENVAWKWVHENQQVDYREFSKFYSDLSEFAKERFKSNSSIEAQKQEMVKFHNLSISTFPGIIYNYFLKIKPLVYTNGFVTQETAALFAKPK